MKFLLVLFIAMAGQDEPIVREFDQPSIEQCLSIATKFVSSKEVLALDDVKGIAAMCQANKEPERQAK